MHFGVAKIKFVKSKHNQISVLKLARPVSKASWFRSREQLVKPKCL